MSFISIIISVFDVRIHFLSLGFFFLLYIIIFFRLAARGKRNLTILKYFVFTHVINAVDERIIATVAHGQPIKTEPYNIDVSVAVDLGEDVLQDVVRLQRKPTECEQCHHNDEHLYHL